jgi:thiol-disulfide isomerase/thioredoxin
MKTLVTAIAILMTVQDPPLKQLAIGDPAPDFSLPGVDGKTYTLADFASSKVLVVVFTSNHCPTAQAYEERLKKIVADYKPKGVAVVAIQPNSPKGLRLDELGYTEYGDTLEEMKLRAREKEFNFPYVDDGDTQKVSRAYGCKATPHVFLFDDARKLRYAGRIDDSEHPEHVKVSDLRNALDAVLAGKEIEVPMTKTFGCSTKWASKEESVKKFMEKVAAEPITLETVDDAGIAALRRNDAGKLRLVYFWSPSRAEDLPALVEINRMYRHRAFEMVTIAVSGDKEGVEKALKQAQCSARNLLLAGPSAEGDQDRAVPSSLLIQAEGRVLYKSSGRINPVDLKKSIVNTLGRFIDKKK